MKFIISTSELNQILHKLQNIVSLKPTIPILSNFLIEAQNDELIISATDLTVGMRCYTEAKIYEEGATTLPGKRLTSLIRELTAPDVQICTNQHEVTEIQTNASQFKLNGMSRREFPSLPDLAGAIQFKINQGLLKDMLYRTSSSVPKEDTRFILTGVHLQIANGTLNFGGTDGKRLAKTYKKIDLEPSVEGSYVIPLKAVEEIQKNLRDDEEATVYLMQDKVAVEINGSILITKLLSGDYPDLSRVIPQEFKFHYVLHRDEMISLLRQVALFVAQPDQAIRFTFANGEVQLCSNAMEIGEGKVSMPVNCTGPLLEIAFHPGVFLDILRHCKQETVSLLLTDAYTPGIIIEGDTLPSSIMQANPLFLLMPMRIHEE